MKVGTINNKIAIYNGNVVLMLDIYTIQLEVSGTSFPNVQTASTTFRVDSSEANNTMYIDFKDGTGEKTFNPNSGNNHIYTNSILYYYQDVPSDIKNTVTPSYDVHRLITIRFKNPQAVTSIIINNFGVHGDVPISLGLFSLTTLNISSAVAYSRFNQFPTGVGGLNATNVVLSYAFETMLTVFPVNLANSRITFLSLANVFNFSGLPSVTRFDRISQIVGLTTLTLNSLSIGNDSLPNTLKDITTLRTITIASQPLTTFSPSLNNCSQVTDLVFTTLTSFNSWGLGVGNMVSLNRFQATTVPNMPLTAPSGLANCVNLKTWTYAGSTINSSTKSDSFSNWMYDFVVANASIAVGNTKFRQMTINIANSAAAQNAVRPSGTYQDVATPTTPMEKIWKMVNVYKHTWSVRNAANNGTEILAP